MNVKLTKTNVFSSESTIDSAVIPAFRGEGDVNYICAGCDAVIAENMLRGQISDMNVKCPRCGTTSAFPKIL